MTFGTDRSEVEVNIMSTVDGSATSYSRTETGPTGKVAQSQV